VSLALALAAVLMPMETRLSPTAGHLWRATARSARIAEQGPRMAVLYTQDLGQDGS